MAVDVALAVCRLRLYRTFVIVALSVAAAACVSRPVGDDNRDERYATVDRLLAERELVAALKRTERYLRDVPNDSVLLARRGEILYRMQRLSEAVAAFAVARKYAPNSYNLLHWQWRAGRAQAVSIAEFRAEVETEIAAMLARGGDEFVVLMTAYRGYGLLRMRDQQRRLVPRLLAAPIIDGNSVAELLTEELFTIRDRSERLDLAQRLLQRFPDHRHAPRIAVVLLRELDRRHADTATLLHTIEPFLAAARHTEYWINPLAELLLRRGQLDAAAAILALAAGPAPVAPYDYGAIPSEARLRAAKAQYLKGVLAYRQRRWADAEARFAESLRDYPRDAAAQFYAGEVAYARGDAAAAIEYFVAALREQPMPAAENRLHELLRRRPDFDTEPAQYFSQIEGQVRFQDLTTQWGMGGVAAQQLAWGDYDNDGFDDLLIDGTRIYRNDGGRRFLQMNDKLGIPERDKGVGIWLDTDDDGDLDLVSASARHFELWRNDSHGFTAVTEAAFAARPTGPVTAVAAGDIDNDGRLDLYLAKFELGIERGFCAPDQLFRNRGRNRFVDVTRRRGIITDEPHCARGVTMSDIDADGDHDILVANYRLDPNFLWVNRGRWRRFQERAKQHGLRGQNAGGYYGHTLGMATGDVDGDGDIDAYVSNLAHPRHATVSDLSQLLINAGGPEFGFDNAWQGAGIGYEESSADPLFIDFDHDGDLDLFVSIVYNGRSSRLYRNDGAGVFTDVTWLSGTRVDNAWGVAASDIDHDGDIDLAVASPDGMRILVNAGTDRHWLQVRVRDRTCNRFGVGARVQIDYGRQSQIREINVGRGSGNQDSGVVTFGLGMYSGAVDIVVRNLCRQTSRGRVASVDRVVTVP